MTTAIATTPFHEWTGGRTVPSLGTNDGADPIAFQRWHHFKESFPPELIAAAVASSQRRVERCLDPFGGSGTTALACQMLGIDSDTIEVNPFLADVIAAKLQTYDIDALIRDLMSVRRTARLQPSIGPDEYFAHTPKSFIERPDSERWIFATSTASRIASILTAIDMLDSQPHRRLFRVIVGGLLAEVSNVIVSGKGRRYRRNWQQAPDEPGRVDALFSCRAEQAIRDIQRFAHRPRVKATLHRGDARTQPVSGEFDLAVFSPPYPNSFDYTDVYNLELWMLGYLKETQDNRRLRTSTLSSHVQLMREYAPAPDGSSTLLACLAQLDTVAHSLWSQWIPKMIGAYFADLITVIEKVYTHLGPSAEAWIVVGDSQYADTLVPVADILAELAVSRGWHIHRQEPIRHMKSSPQQGWKPKLAESLLVIKGC